MRSIKIDDTCLLTSGAILKTRRYCVLSFYLRSFRGQRCSSSAIHSSLSRIRVWLFTFEDARRNPSERFDMCEYVKLRTTTKTASFSARSIEVSSELHLNKDTFAWNFSALNSNCENINSPGIRRIDEGVHAIVGIHLSIYTSTLCQRPKIISNQKS